MIFVTAGAEGTGQLYERVGIHSCKKTFAERTTQDSESEMADSEPDYGGRPYGILKTKCAMRETIYALASVLMLMVVGYAVVKVWFECGC